MRSDDGTGGAAARASSRFPASAGILLGIGLGGFVDGIVLHQILQWHHMATSAGYPPDTVDNLKLNTLLDGLFHAFAWTATAAGLAVLWAKARSGAAGWAGRSLIGTMLMGFGLFNLIEGLVNHQLLGLHHVNETVPREQWLWWDLGFLASGAVLIGVGLALHRSARPKPAGR